LAQWLGALHLILFSMLYCSTEEGGVMENGEIKQIKELLANDLYDSKDWREGDFIDRVEWLISTVKSQAEEIELWLGQIERLREDVAELKYKEAYFSRAYMAARRMLDERGVHMDYFLSRENYESEVQEKNNDARRAAKRK
jgi:hypothetical protein